MKENKCYLDQLALKKIENKKKKYHKDIDDCVKYILFVIQKIEETGHFWEYVASVKAVLSEDYADRLPYEDMTTNEIYGYLQELEGLKEEALGVLAEANKMKRCKNDEEIGRASFGALGIESIDELDDARFQQHEKEQDEANAKKQVFAAAFSALKGKSSSLQEFFLPGDGKKTNSGDDDN